MLGVAMTNYPAPTNDGHSCAFDADGSQVTMLKEQEEVALAEFDLDFIRTWQEKEAWRMTFL